MSNEVIVQNERQVDNQGFMRVNNIDEAIRCSELIASSSFCPKGMMGKPGDVLVALQMGQELGLKPMQALQNIAVVNGRPSVWGDAMLAIIRQSPEFEFIDEQDDGETATCTIKRKNEPPVVRTFSMADAKTAGLAGKEGPWRTYPKRMRQMRARGYAARDSFPDTLRGIIIKEEAEDTPTERKDYSMISGSAMVIDATNCHVSQHEISILQEKIKESGTSETDILTHLNVMKIQDMQISQYSEICRLLDKKIAKKNKAMKLEVNKYFEEADGTTTVPQES
jgi:hypothetical protein